MRDIFSILRNIKSEDNLKPEQKPDRKYVRKEQKSFRDRLAEISDELNYRNAKDANIFYIDPNSVKS